MTALLVSACSSGGTDSTSVPAAATTTATSNPASHNEADVTFAQGMIPHHEQAIEMSDVLLAKKDINPQVLSLAGDIKKAQAPEIETMRGWLTQWGAPATGTMPGMPGHDMPGMSHDGMMSAADMTALQNAQGGEAARLFLTQMIRHHEGAVAMAQQEISAGQFPAAKELARNIVSSQQQEITTMRNLLKAV